MGLEPVTEYKFQVFALNGVSDLTGESPKKVEITAVTEASVVSVITKLRVVSVESDKLSLAWNPPPIDLTDPDDSIESYEVKCFPKDHMEKSANATVRITKEPHVIITGLKRDTEYGIRVRAKMKKGWGELSGIVYARTGSVLETSFVGEEEGAQVRLVAGVMVAVVVLSVIAIIATVLFLRSRSDDECDKKQPSDCNALNYRNGEVYTGPDRPAKTGSNATTPLFAGTDMIQFSSVEEWLECIKMSRYIEKFRTAGITDMNAVVDLTVHQLASLGVTLVGHQKKIMNSVQSMRAQIRVSGPYGFLV
ncbi:Eph receptor [Danaus plexippus plexippus]|uniref:Eph receptor n=1 Tax=Danaus plexippus plexippus TaxID=278856 RepID=A0A212EQJ2_DANPL|nr:Eph receptor [Danaus plexippus plexippus]